MKNNLKCTFYRTEEVKLREWDNIIGKMKNDLELICEPETAEFEIKCYVHDLINHAKPLEKNPDMWFFGFDEPHNMPSDARVDYFYYPTYIATAIMVKAVMRCPELLAETAVYDALQHCLLASTGRGFKGHGYEELDGVRDAMDIFLQADTYRFVKKYAEICPEFTELFTSVLEIQMNRK